ncbi:DUF4440 domain-containing protein [Microbulbifer sp. CNSA002]|uniref:nuclear transport factor 2 family protein n=1 Tax=unclassified Microbulbifer TaxID=2619833 RepID=UPI0039B5BF41
MIHEIADILIENETKLHQFEIRKDPEVISKLLSPNFIEVGKSGRTFDFKAIVRSMQQEENTGWEIHSQNYECIPLSDTVIMLLYKSARRGQQGEYKGFCKRSSIWVRSKGQWQMKFHQGTPCQEFKLEDNISRKQPAFKL